jgi:hypothetical protein
MQQCPPITNGGIMSEVIPRKGLCAKRAESNLLCLTEQNTPLLFVLFVLASMVTCCRVLLSPVLAAHGPGGAPGFRLGLR